MPESPDNTIIMSNLDLPFTDGHGIVYSLTHNGRLVVNGMREGSQTSFIIRKLAYVGRLVWAMDHQGMWRCRRRPGDPWSPPRPESPLILDRLECLEIQLHELKTSIMALTDIANQILAWVNDHRATKIALDIPGAQVTSQPVPENPGP